MPRAIDALSGEVKTLLSFCAALSRRKSANEKSFEAPMTRCSPAVSARGGSSSGVPGAPGSVALARAAASAADARYRD